MARRNGDTAPGSAPKAKVPEKGPAASAAAAVAKGYEWQSACTPEQVKARGTRKPVNLALQGGGAHGAFGWGVLDKLLEDDRLALDAMSATSAGAMNAVVMAVGYSQGGREGARERLNRFWREVSLAGQIWNPVQVTSNGDYRTPASSIGYWMFETVTRVWSPYQLNPFDLNPLKDILTKVVDFERLRQCPHAPRLFLSATNVRTSKIRVFENAEITADAVMASACLPYLFKAVEIDGEHFWDGGFMGNPAIFPLIYKGASRDVIVVHINPIVRDTLPTTAPEIFDRMNEISFNSSLMREMRAIAFVTKLLEEEAVDDRRYKRMLIHSIRNDREMARHGVETKLDSSWTFLERLRDAGREAAAQWLDSSYGDVGKRTTVDLTETYL